MVKYRIIFTGIGLGVGGTIGSFVGGGVGLAMSLYSGNADSLAVCGTVLRKALLEPIKILDNYRRTHKGKITANKRRAYCLA